MAFAQPCGSGVGTTAGCGGSSVSVAGADDAWGSIASGKIADAELAGDASLSPLAPSALVPSLQPTSSSPNASVVATNGRSTDPLQPIQHLLARVRAPGASERVESAAHRCGVSLTFESLRAREDAFGSAVLSGSCRQHAHIANAHLSCIVTVTMWSPPLARSSASSPKSVPSVGVNSPSHDPPQRHATSSARTPIPACRRGG